MYIRRRQYCGMIKGLDEGIKNITEAARTLLGENTIVYVLSDNGGKYMSYFNELITNGII